MNLRHSAASAPILDAVMAGLVAAWFAIVSWAQDAAPAPRQPSEAD